MHYTEDEFLRLMDEIEFQGGVYLDQTHDNAYHTKMSGSAANTGWEVKYCGNAALFEIPYEIEGNADTMAVMEVCAVCDRLGAWPRYANADATGQG